MLHHLLLHVQSVIIRGEMWRLDIDRFRDIIGRESISTKGHFMVKILVLKEKHDTRYFDVSTPEKRFEACDTILMERWNEGYYYTEPQESEYMNPTWRKHLDVTDEEFEGLPEAIRESLRTERESVLSKAENAAARFSREQKIWTKLLEYVNTSDTRARAAIITSKNTPWAEAFLYTRSNYEYEAFYIIETEN